MSTKQKRYSGIKEMDFGSFTPEVISNAFIKHGYSVHVEPYRLNIFGVRANLPATNKFDDMIGVFYKDFAGTWNLQKYMATTDAGFSYLRSPIVPKGTAILAPNQYKDAYCTGKHLGQYRALVQHAPMDFWRNKPADLKRTPEGYYAFDKTPEKIIRAVIGANIHHAGEYSTFINNWSAACQVFAILKDFNGGLMVLVDAHLEQKYPDLFDYTLFDEVQMQRV